MYHSTTFVWSDSQTCYALINFFQWALITRSIICLFFLIVLILVRQLLVRCLRFFFLMLFLRLTCSPTNCRRSLFSRLPKFSIPFDWLINPVRRHAILLTWLPRLMWQFILNLVTAPWLFAWSSEIFPIINFSLQIGIFLLIDFILDRLIADLSSLDSTSDKSHAFCESFNVALILICSPVY